MTKCKKVQQEDSDHEEKSRRWANCYELARSDNEFELTSRWTLGESITVRVYRLAGGAGNQEREARKSQKHNWSTLGGTLCVTQTPSQLCCTYSNVHWTPTVHPRTHLIRASFTAPSLSPPPTHTHTHTHVFYEPCCSFDQMGSV